jgi:mannose/fructose/N-acetylgalactosamine-specific phosphotransferase system component IID
MLAYLGIGTLLTSIVGGIASFAIGGFPLGQIIVNVFQTVLTIFTEFVKMVFDLMKTPQGRWVLFFAACAIALLWAYFHVENKGYDQGYKAGVEFEKQHAQKCPAPAKQRRG